MTAYTDAAAAVQRARQARDEARDALYRLQLERLTLERPSKAAAADVAAPVARNAKALAAQRSVVNQRTDDVASAIGSLYDGSTPQELVANWDDSLPILLLPVRVETRWKTDLPGGAAPQLWVRVYPDDVAITTHEQVLTSAEVAAGQAYWGALRAAGSDSGAQTLAWNTLADRFGGNRAAWVALETRPLNWSAAVSDPSIALQFPDPGQTKPDAWTIAPHTRILPDRFVLLAWRGDVLRVTLVGNPIDDIVILGPAPSDDPGGDSSIARNSNDQTLSFGDAFAWIRDFDRAVQNGMGFRVPLSADDVTQGFDRLLVLGLKLSANAPDAQQLVEQIIDDHHYGREGFAVLRQGTPTNNTDGGASGYSRGADDEKGVAESTPPRFVPDDDRTVATDGQRLADFLGISYAPLLYASGADNADNAEAVAMNRALYAGTLGYYLDHMLNEAVDDNWLGALRQHFTDHVTGRGPIAAIRVGNQPYGILPTSSLARWKPSTVQRGTGVVTLGGAPDPFESTLLRVLTRFDQAWSSVVPQVVQVASAGNGAANLLEVLGLQPTSAEFYQRVGYSYDYLKNLEAFAWGGSSYADVLKMMMEAMGARILLGQLGYVAERADGTPKAYPLLLQLIWRHYQTALDPKQLIDGQPLSETARIKPYSSGSSNYIDWLLANASNSTALQAQDFGGAAPPNGLLYLMLYFSVVMEAARGIRGWLTSRNVTSEELVRSRKFLNIGPQPSPSLWEVFRAPANRVAVGDPATASLLQVVNAPPLAGDAGQSVQEQRAAIGALRSLPTARLERALVEHIDTLSYRLDAWETSLFAKRLFRQRQMSAATQQRRTGVYLGSYGYLEDLRANPGRRQAVADRTLPAAVRTGAGNLYTEQGNGGYVHAPSLNHATAAALLRNGYLTHASPNDPTALAVNVSSGRVQRASYLLEGIRNGQTLEALLGIQFERGLHDWTTRPTNPVVLDQLVPLFRTQFPILLTKVPQATDANSGASQVTVDYQVVNGLTLALTTDPFPYGITELSTLSTEQQSAIQTEKAALADTLDALRDVLTAESAYQLALGNFDRAAAVLQSAGNGTVPPDVEVLATPRGTGIAFTQRLAVHLTTAIVNNPWSAIPLGERAKLESAINAWLGDLLGAPDQIRCTVAALAADGSVLVVGGNPVQATISLADLGIQPIDFVYIVRNQAEPSGAAELEARIRYTFARQHNVADDIVVRITFAAAGAGSNVRSFAEVLPLADRLRRLLGTARPLDARHYRSASKDPPPASPDNPGAFDISELRTRVGARLTAVRGLVPPLAAAATTVRAGATIANVDALRATLTALANAGVNYAVPRSAIGVDAARVQSLLDQTDALVSRLTALGTATDDQLATADAAAGADQKLSILSDAIKAWMGSDVLLLPHFVFADPGSVSQADAARDQLLAYARNTLDIALPVEEWLHGAACVRPLVRDFEMIRLLADTVRDDALLLSAIQLPFRTGDSWLGAQFPQTMQVVHDTISVVQHLPQGFDATAAQCGLLIDEWVESIPTRAEVTGIAFNYSAPNSAPPQSLLLAVTPDETGRWQWDDLVDSVLDTFRRARLRAVEPDMLGDLPGIGTLLPAVVAEFGTSAASVSLDYSFTVTAIAEPVMAMMGSASA